MKKFFLNYAQFVVFDFSLFNFCDLTSFKKFSKPLLNTLNLHFLQTKFQQANRATLS